MTKLKYQNPNLIFLLILLILFSCIDSDKNQVFRAQKDRLLQDSLYKVEWLEIDYGNKQIEQVQLYISKNKDTISNQFKQYINGKLNILQSEFYDLEISETKKPGIYKGQITIHTKHDNLALNKDNRKTLQLHYCEQSLDSIYLKYKETKTSNTINFEFENAYGNNFQGLIYLTVERDTIIDNEEMVNLYRLPMLVDNKTLTDNLFLESYEFDKKNKFNPDQIKLH